MRRLSEDGFATVVGLSAVLATGAGWLAGVAERSVMLLSFGYFLFIEVAMAISVFKKRINLFQ
jgi:hypothetical protein